MSDFDSLSFPEFFLEPPQFEGFSKQNKLSACASQLLVATAAEQQQQSGKMSSAAMENFVMNVRTLSSQGNFTELNEFLQKNMEILVRNPAHLGNVLETLDIQQHSLGVLAVMSAKLQQSEINDWEDLFNRLTIFIMECNGEQIRYAAQR